METDLPDDVRRALGLPSGATFGDAIALAQARQAIKGETAAAKEMREAIEGRSMEQLDVGKEFSVVIINRAYRPDWKQMRRGKGTIDVPGLTGNGNGE